jgi:hypothetical protein
MTADAKIYVNDANVARSRRGEAKPLPRETFLSQANGLIYRSTTEPPVEAGAEREPAGARPALVDQHLDRRVGFQNSSPLPGFSQREIDEAIDNAALRRNVNANLTPELGQGGVEFQSQCGFAEGRDGD